MNWLHGLMIAWSMSRKASGLGSSLPPTVQLKLTTQIVSNPSQAVKPVPASASAKIPHKVTVAVEGDGHDDEDHPPAKSSTVAGACHSLPPLHSLLYLHC